MSLLRNIIRSNRVLLQHHLKPNKKGGYSFRETKFSSPLEGHGLAISRWGAFGPAFTSRSMTTDARSREPVSSSTNDIAPLHIKFKRLDKTARHIMQACIFIASENVIFISYRSKHPNVTLVYRLLIKNKFKQ
ncbi:hypothetical protein MKW92_050777 [Papaver armeniacum]|nr:hypothetical protein MKW92_050777 [Papaver armeniacum]